MPREAVPLLDPLCPSVLLSWCGFSTWLPGQLCCGPALFPAGPVGKGTWRQDLNLPSLCSGSFSMLASRGRECGSQVIDSYNQDRRSPMKWNSDPETSSYRAAIILHTLGEREHALLIPPPECIWYTSKKAQVLQGHKNRGLGQLGVSGVTPQYSMSTWLSACHKPGITQSALTNLTTKQLHKFLFLSLFT